MANGRRRQTNETERAYDGDDRRVYEDTECGIEGMSDDPITKREFNRWAARTFKSHLEPMKADLAATVAMRVDMAQVRHELEKHGDALYNKETGIIPALYDPKRGLVNMRDWICRSAVVTGVVIGGIFTAVPFIRWMCAIMGWGCA